ncbi:hypothetical protein WN944_025457 [Citrus x changshan-huyou]|uniref:Uncharacterized protein n=1 Tax=Citrus x changshan-huyou TaxID=2935761 RepID=A0AAP0QCZ1_9ROSI
MVGASCSVIRTCEHFSGIVKGMSSSRTEGQWRKSIYGSFDIVVSWLRKDVHDIDDDGVWNYLRVIQTSNRKKVPRCQPNKGKKDMQQ